MLLFWFLEDISRSSCLSAFYKIGVLKIFTKFLGKHKCRGLFWIKLQTFSMKFIKVKTTARIFFNEFSKTFKNTFFTGHLYSTLLIFRKLDIQTLNSKQICSLDQYCWHDIFDEGVCFLRSIKFEKHVSTMELNTPNVFRASVL